MKIDMNEVGKRIRRVREKRRLTLEQMARIIGRDKQTVWRWEKAERGVSLKTLNLLAEKLDCHPSYLLGYHEDINATFEPPGEPPKNITPRTFGRKMRELRKDKNISIERFARSLGVPESRITELENMICSPSDSELSRIAAALDVSEENLSKDCGTWSDDRIPHAAVLELARKMLDIDPYLNIYLEQMGTTDAEAVFLAAAIRLGFERKSNSTKP